MWRCRVYSTSTTSMTWQAYFQRRKQRRRYEVLTAIPSSALFFLLSTARLSVMEFDPTTTLFGLDPMLVMAGVSVSSGVAGYLLGPVFGNQLFRMRLSPSEREAMMRKDAALYWHVVRNRAPAETNSIRNPVPDYYGEHITSVQAYRAWLRKQRMHERKALFHV